MKHSYFNFLLLLSLYLFSNSLQASHISGGTMTYECLGNNQYKVKMTLFRDCYGVTPIPGITPYDNPANFTIHSNNPAIAPQTVTAAYNPNHIGTVNTNVNSCFLPPIICFDSTFYEFTVTLPYDSLGYYIAYQRCCRDNALTNLNNPGQTGMTLSIFLSNTVQLTCNNSPTFDAPTSVLSCVNTPLQLDFGAKDVDGDSLVYSLCSPFTGATPFNPIPTVTTAPPFSTVNYNNGYSASQPFSGNISINSDYKTITFSYLRVESMSSAEFFIHRFSYNI